jgi:glycosyltransferase involved in cell wall biosynthesis
MALREGLVSVVVPTYNREDLVPEAIESALLQTYPDLEVIVVDDGSQDGTEAQVQRFMGRDPRVKFIRFPENRGHPAAMNAGIEAARGEFLHFLDSDDLLHREKLRVQVQSLREHPEADLAVAQTGFFFKTPGDTDLIYGTFGGEQDWLLRFVRHEVAWITIGPLWRRESLDRVGHIGPGLKSNIDYELHTRALILGAKPIFNRHILAFYRRHEGPTIGKLDNAVRVKNLCGVFLSLLELLRKENKLTDRLAQEVSINLWWIAGRLVEEGLRDEAREAARVSAEVEPDATRAALAKALAEAVGDPKKEEGALAALGFTRHLREQWFFKHRAMNEPLEPLPPAPRYRRSQVTAP